MDEHSGEDIVTTNSSAECSEKDKSEEVQQAKDDNEEVQQTEVKGKQLQQAKDISVRYASCIYNFTEVSAKSECYILEIHQTVHSFLKVTVSLGSSDDETR